MTWEMVNSWFGLKPGILSMCQREKKVVFNFLKSRAQNGGFLGKLIIKGMHSERKQIWWGKQLSKYVVSGGEKLWSVPHPGIQTAAQNLSHLEARMLPFFKTWTAGCWEGDRQPFKQESHCTKRILQKGGSPGAFTGILTAAGNEFTSPF